MEIVCDGCGKKYVVPDDKIPASGAVAVTCKGCGNRITIKGGGAVREGGGGEAGAEKGRKSGVLSREARDKVMEFFRPGAKTALWYCPQAKAADEIARQLKQLGFETREVKEFNELAARLRYHGYDLILLYQDTHEADAELQGILDFINSMSLDERRRIFVILMHLSGNRVDELQAFFRGVDLTLNPIDLAKLREIVPYEMEKKKGFYTRFLEIKEKVAGEAAI